MIGWSSGEEPGSPSDWRVVFCLFFRPAAKRSSTRSCCSWRSSPTTSTGGTLTYGRSKSTAPAREPPPHLILLLPRRLKLRKIPRFLVLTSQEPHPQSTVSLHFDGVPHLRGSQMRTGGWSSSPSTSRGDYYSRRWWCKNRPSLSIFICFDDGTAVDGPLRETKRALVTTLGDSYFAARGGGLRGGRLGRRKRRRSGALGGVAVGGHVGVAGAAHLAVAGGARGHASAAPAAGLAHAVAVVWPRVLRAPHLAQPWALCNKGERERDGGQVRLAYWRGREGPAEEKGPSRGLPFSSTGTMWRAGAGAGSGGTSGGRRPPRS